MAAALATRSPAAGTRCSATRRWRHSADVDDRSHLPRAFGVALALGAKDAPELAWPRDAVVVTSFGDASSNHSTAVGALNAAGHSAHRGADVPLLIVCEDNGIGISTRSQDGWVEAALRGRPGVEYAAADGADPSGTLITARAVADAVRTTRRPAILHLHTVRFGGHAGSDVEIGYRSHSEIIGDDGRDPLLATARMLVAAHVLTPAAVRDRYEAMRQAVMAEAETVGAELRLDTPEAVMAPLTATRSVEVRAAAAQAPAAGARVLVARRAPEDQGALTLAQSINSALADGLSTWPEASVFGRGRRPQGRRLRRHPRAGQRFGGRDLGHDARRADDPRHRARGSLIAGCCRSPRSSTSPTCTTPRTRCAVRRRRCASSRTATTPTDGGADRRPRLPEGLRRALPQRQLGRRAARHSRPSRRRCPATPTTPPGMLRTCLAPPPARAACASISSRSRCTTRATCTRRATTRGPRRTRRRTRGHRRVPLGKVHTHRDGEDLTLVTFGNGLHMSLRAAAALEAAGIRCTCSTCAGWRRCRSTTCSSTRGVSGTCSWLTRRAPRVACPRACSQHSSITDTTGSLAALPAGTALSRSVRRPTPFS